jgi:hypothetical protein
MVSEYIRVCDGSSDSPGNKIEYYMWGELPLLRDVNQLRMVPTLDGSTMKSS